MYESNKSKKSVWNALTGITLTLINGFFNIVVISLVISHYGSDFNGLNSTANQIVNLLLVIEGGFSLAVNVALFKPLTDKNYDKLNGILSATKITYKKIGITFFIIGIIASFGYSLTVKSDLPFYVIILVFLMVVFSTAFDLSFATKYRVLFQAEQKEYIINLIKIISVILSQIIIIIMIINDAHMLLLRVSIMICAILNSIFVAALCRKRYSFIDFNTTPEHNAIKGTKELVMQQITGLLYGTIPILFISSTSGTLFASVYSVYNNIFIMIKNISYSFISAPRMGFGKLIVERDKPYVFKIFLQYEFIAINIIMCLLSAAFVLIMPFIKLFTASANDINYENWYVAFFLIAITFFETIHVPSGNLINMSGNFLTSKKIQLTACIFLIVCMFLGSFFIGFYGILAAVLLTAILLAIMETVFVHVYYFGERMSEFIRMIVPNLLAMIVMCYFEYRIFRGINSYLKFALSGIIILLINGCVLLLINHIFNNNMLKAIINRILSSVFNTRVFVKEKFGGEVKK